MDAIESIFFEATKLLQTDEIGSISLKCTNCTRQAVLLKGDLRIFLTAWYNKKCTCSHGYLTVLVANYSNDVI